MNKAFLLLGTNMGNRLHNLQRAANLLAALGTISTRSAVYVTAAWGITDQQDFFNQAVLLETTLTADTLLDAILNIELQLGRARSEKYGPRIIDIDILFFNDEVHDSAHISIPHPQLQLRRFALVPMAELAPNLVHPLLKSTITELLANTSDQLPVKRLANY